MNMICSIFNQLQSLTSTKDKETFISINKNNSQFLELLNINLNPTRQFYIRKLPTYSTSNSIHSIDSNYNSFLELVLKLENRLITGHRALNAVREFFSGCSPEECALYEKILLKQPIGVGLKIVNKVLGDDFIPEFRVMLAPSKIADIRTIQYPCFVSPKIDGFRFIAVISDSVALLSRTGRVLPNKSIPEYFKALQGAFGYVLDGELYDPTLTFQQLDSIITSEETKLPNTLKYYVFDAMPLKDWVNKDCKILYKDRLKVIHSILTEKVQAYSKVVDVAANLASTAMEVKDLYKNYLEAGYEGVMIKSPEGLYRWKRTTHKSGEMLKLKPFQSLDLPIVGFYDGEGKFKGLIGGIIVNYKGKEVRVGSGFTDNQRISITSKKKELLGVIAEIKFLELTDEGSLRHPTFCRLRYDK